MGVLIRSLVSSLPRHPTKKPKTRALRRIKKIIVHTTDWEVSPEDLAKYDIGPNHIDDTGCPTITYHYYINKTGDVYQTALPTWVTWHAALHNEGSLAVCLAYRTDPDYESGKKAKPAPRSVITEEMRAALNALLVELCVTFGVPPTKVLGHRELLGTGFFFSKGHKRLRKTCPGMSVDLDGLRITLATNVQKRLRDEGVYKGAIDGNWGPQSQTALTAFVASLR